jgi:hypothetical protein
MNRMTKVLWWVSGTCQETILSCPKRDQLLRASLGAVFLLNYFVLLGAWLTVGLHFFGGYGILPGILVPSVLLALDRLIAMRHRSLAGILKIYDIGQAENERKFKQLRLCMALALSLITTFTFQLDQANSLIREKAHNLWLAANNDLRKTIVEQINAEYNQELKAVDQRNSVLNAKKALLKITIDDTSIAAKVASSNAIQARTEQAWESGGLYGRHHGKKVRFEAQQDIALLNEAIAADAQTKHQQAVNAYDAINSEIASIQYVPRDAEVKKTDSLSKVDTLMKKDPRFVVEKIGIFSDSTIFVTLFVQKDVAAGMWIMSLLLWMLLLTIELAALIALSLLPTSAYDIALVANLRVTTAGLVAEAESKLQQTLSSTPEPDIYPLASGTRTETVLQ